MFSKLSNIRLKAWHFCIAFIALFVLTHIVGFTGTDRSMSDYNLEELTKINFQDSIFENINFVLFYDKHSDLCDKMESRICEVAVNKNGKARFYKMNVENDRDIISKYRVSGVPCIIVFKDNVEMRRIVGIVSSSNLDMIYNRLVK